MLCTFKNKRKRTFQIICTHFSKNLQSKDILGLLFKLFHLDKNVTSKKDLVVIRVFHSLLPVKALFLEIKMINTEVSNVKNLVSNLLDFSALKIKM